MAASAPLPDEPYRRAVLTPLEALVHRGPADLSAVSPATRSPLLPLGVGQLVLLLGLLQGWGLMLTLSLAGTLMVLPPLVVAVVAQLRWDRRFADLGDALARLPFPVEGFDGWKITHAQGFGPLEIELRERHPLAEAAVRRVEPDAVITWPRDHALWVRLAWHRGEHDLARLRRLLVGVLAAHAEELGVVRVRCLRWPDTVEPAAGVLL